MSFIISILQALGLNENGYRRLKEADKSIKGGALVIGATGLVYGLTNLALFGELLAVMSGRASTVTGALAIVISGIIIAYLVHGGIVLLIWAISKGFRGPGNFALLYGNIGVAMAPLIFGSPLLTYFWLVKRSNSIYWLITPLLIWLVLLLVQSISAAEGHTYKRAGGILLVTVIFSTSLLYLWLP